MARQETANTLINRAAIEIGIAQVADPVGSVEEAFVQLTGLLISCGQELVELNEWQLLRQEINFTTDTNSSATQLGNGVTVDDSGVYDLPADFGYMIDQTGWDRTNDWPLGGPLSAQVWTNLEGSDLSGSTIYAKFRLAENKLEIYPQPTADATQMSFEYISRYWVQASGSSSPDKDTITAGTDTVLFEPIVMVKFLKVKYLEAKGFDSRAARMEFDTLFRGRIGRDVGAPKLNAAGPSTHFPYISSRNVGDTGFGV